MNNPQYTIRFSSAKWFLKVQEKRIILAGLGGIGSYVSLFLSRLNPKQIILFDYDKVDSSNLGGQLYSKSHIGNYKVTSAVENMMEFSNYSHIIAYSNPYESSITEDIMICGFDNMAARKQFFEAWLNHVRNSEHPENCLFIDARLNAEEFQIFCIQGKDSNSINTYRREYLFTDNIVQEPICSYKQTSHIAAMLAAFVVNYVTIFCMNEVAKISNPDSIDVILPDFMYYNAITFTLTQENF
jgi:molybdopterin/thiamine biosynthesis adenylyltransferase